MRKRYLVTVETRKYQIDLDEAECEQLRLHYHGFCGIEELVVLDFAAIAQELHEEK